ncbi:hypothetical protein LR48_Vigan728s001400 [Vigna angularis]|uniref:Uncharacterized protein n=2 Tax=Phaseolus angularis TaxID=3914 RepID=A0A0L9TGH5_PHAAN|nr:uncharacterized protein HKW66_Vig0023620 [Vigna angularis]KOM29591.1 hypothetical protein LR48_Vigan728s001400 [Vigna angularis]BAT76796.1 hypothetical protein VIGAN_01485200 [Vigna angularis var. angularis]
MGLEVFDDFRPIMSVPTLPTLRTFSHRPEVVQTWSKDDQDCHTPTSQPPTLVCPPPPKKPRLSVSVSTTTTITTTTFPSQPFFQVPHDLASVFLLRAKPSSSEQPLC